MARGTFSGNCRTPTLKQDILPVRTFQGQGMPTCKADINIGRCTDRETDNQAEACHITVVKRVWRHKQAWLAGVWATGNVPAAGWSNGCAV